MTRPLVALVILFASVVAVRCQTLAKSDFARVDFEQRIGQRIPLNAAFLDDTGASVRLGTLFGDHPVILALAYYDCPNLCTLVLNGLLESVRDLRSDVGRDFEIVVISIRPGESSALAHAKKDTYSMRYGRPGTKPGWHFLTGDSRSIRQITDAVGYRYVYDPISKQFAHPSGIVVLSPTGVVSRYFLGIEYPPKDLHAAIGDASRERTGTLATRLLLLCFHFDPKTGRYSLIIARALQAAGIGTVLLLGAAIARLSRRKPGVHGPGSGALAAFSLTPERASSIAGSVDAIFYTLVVVCGLITLAIFAAIIYFSIVYRAGSPAKRPVRRTSPIRFEIAWTSLTLLAFIAIFFWAGAVYFRMSRPPDNASEIHVIAKQWMWKAQHPNGRREINELHLLVNQPVKLVMTSQDVIHDFFVPAFRTKQDVLPGRYTMEWFSPTKTGTYHLFCAEYCGMDHSGMGGWIHVLDPSEYSEWLAREPATESLIATGARLFQARGCTGCHSPSSVIPSPPLEGLFGKPVALGDGTVVIADEQYLHDSILLPNKQITAGYEAKMPTFQGQLDEEEVMALIAYLKSLGPTPARNR